MWDRCDKPSIGVFVAAPPRAPDEPAETFTPLEGESVATEVEPLAWSDTAESPET